MRIHDCSLFVEENLVQLVQIRRYDALIAPEKVKIHIVTLILTVIAINKQQRVCVKPKERIGKAVP